MREGFGGWKEGYGRGEVKMGDDAVMVCRQRESIDKQKLNGSYYTIE